MNETILGIWGVLMGASPLVGIFIGLWLAEREVKKKGQYYIKHNPCKNCGEQKSFSYNIDMGGFWVQCENEMCQNYCRSQRIKCSEVKIKEAKE